MNDGLNKVVQSSRKVIERKLLTALDDPDIVAILASKEDLDLFILYLGTAANTRANELARGLEQLRREAVGKRSNSRHAGSQYPVRGCHAPCANV